MTAPARLAENGLINAAFINIILSEYTPKRRRVKPPIRTLEMALYLASAGSNRT